ncbi:hypothetical protein C0991_011279 [Blastosporella zonata]|nr:hypothetical protein C0991_011279 [Blastosporella zonata]
MINIAGPSKTVPSDSIEAIQRQADQGKKLVDNFVNADISEQEFFSKLCTIGIIVDQAKDFAQQAQEHMDVWRAKKQQVAMPIPNPDLPTSIDEAAEDTVWDEFEASLAIAKQWPGVSFLMDKLVKIFDDRCDRKHQSGILDSVIAIAPHLAQQAILTEDPHVKQTKELKRVYSSDRALEALLDFARGQFVKDPMSHGIWKLIILD